jgi:hypothetical protein
MDPVEIRFIQKALLKREERRFSENLFSDSETNSTAWKWDSLRRRDRWHLCRLFPHSLWRGACVFALIPTSIQASSRSCQHRGVFIVPLPIPRSVHTGVANCEKYHSNNKNFSVPLATGSKYLPSAIANSCMWHLKGRWPINVHYWEFVSKLPKAVRDGQYLLRKMLYRLFQYSLNGFWWSGSGRTSEPFGMLRFGSWIIFPDPDPILDPRLGTSFLVYMFYSTFTLKMVVSFLTTYIRRFKVFLT